MSNEEVNLQMFFDILQMAIKENNGSYSDENNNINSSFNDQNVNIRESLMNAFYYPLLYKIEEKQEYLQKSVKDLKEELAKLDNSSYLSIE